MSEDSIKQFIDAVASSASDDFSNEVELICMSNVDIKPIEWLWPGRIALGKLTVIAGNPGLGKSQLTAMLAANVTKGRAWPDGGRPPPLGHTIFLSAEDDAADTIKPRLMAADADIARCHFLDAVRIKGSDGKAAKRGFDLKQDVEILGAKIASLGAVRLAVIDPISAYLGDTNSHNNAEMRGLLMPLAAMAAKHGIAILLVTHLTKEEKQEAIGRVMGSIALIAAARAGFIVTKNDKNPETRYFVPIKNNIGNDRDGFEFHIEEVTLTEEITTSRICWHEGLVQAENILHPPEEVKPTATNGAKTFLEDLLKDKPMLVTDIFSEAVGACHSKAVIQRAASKLGIKRKKLGMDGGWQWSMPKTDIYGNPSEDAEGIEDSNE